MRTPISRGLHSAFDCLPRIYFDLADYEHTVFLAGSGRSGTTWLEDVINFDGSYRIVFEPFHSRRVPILSAWNYRQYLRPSNRADRFLKPATRILKGKVRGRWVDKFRCKLIVRKRLIKDIRANLILKWLQQNFPPIRIVLFLRHPCAVASSKLKLGWETHLEDFLAQEELMQDHLNPFKSHIQAATDSFDKHIFMWCIENYVPLRQFRDGEVLVQFYERICVSPEDSIKDLFHFLDQPYSPTVLKAMKTPSAVSRPHSAIVTGDSLIDAWRSTTTNRQAERALEILKLFGLHNVYGESSIPLTTSKDVTQLLSR